MWESDSKESSESWINYTVLILRHQNAAFRAEKFFQIMGLRALKFPIFQLKRSSQNLLHINQDDMPLITSASVFEVMTLQEKAQLKAVSQILVVGESTALVAREEGFRNITVTGKNSDDMVIFIQKHLPQNIKLIHLRGKISHFDYKTLEKRGYCIERQILYEQVLCEQEWKNAQRTIHNFPKLLIPVYSVQTAQLLNGCLQGITLENRILLCMSERIRKIFSFTENVYVVDFMNPDLMKKNLHELGVFRHN